MYRRNTMKGNYKKILCALIAGMTAMSAVPAMAALPAEVTGTRYEEPV
jgi:siroheme synthase